MKQDHNGISSSEAEIYRTEPRILEACTGISAVYECKGRRNVLYKWDLLMISTTSKRPSEQLKAF